MTPDEKIAAVEGRFQCTYPEAVRETRYRQYVRLEAIIARPHPSWTLGYACALAKIAAALYDESDEARV